MYIYTYTYIYTYIYINFKNIVQTLFKNNSLQRVIQFPSPVSSITTADPLVIYNQLKILF